ncbi:MAG: sigma 54-interacting transcriptional regulator [Planctomycetes bacterium]|nr:sigma 54-interacting transcriptional regulator [Planctomycetota bacterium]
MSASADSFRWQTFFQHAAQPMFLLNRRRRVLFVNRAWESSTGIKCKEIRGRVCRRRPAATDREELILSACAPPAEALEGRTCNVHRRAPVGAGWWEIHFLPLVGAEGLLGTLGAVRLHVKADDAPPALPDKLMALRDRAAARYRLDDITDSSPAMRRLREQARLAARTRVPITLIGEPGVGKEWLARAIHADSDQRHQFFAALDAKRLPGNLLGETIFNPRGGLGAVYLREPAFLPREWQARLAETLRLNENPEFPRLIVGFEREPKADLESGRLVEEFYCAASPMIIAVPPLRERPGELPRLIDNFLTRIRDVEAHGVREVAPEVNAMLQKHTWPENLRELYGVLHGACRRAQGPRIELADLPFFLKQGTLPPERTLPLDTLLEQVEKRLIALALRLTQDNQTRAAELLEIWRPRLMRRMERFGFKPPE